MLQAIIEACDITKLFMQPDGGRIEVIAPTDLHVSEHDCGSARSVWFWKVDPSENALWAGAPFGLDD